MTGSSVNTLSFNNDRDRVLYNWFQKLSEAQTTSRTVLDEQVYYVYSAWFLFSLFCYSYCFITSTRVFLVKKIQKIIKYQIKCHCH